MVPKEPPLCKNLGMALKRLATRDKKRRVCRTKVSVMSRVGWYTQREVSEPAGCSGVGV